MIKKEQTFRSVYQKTKDRVYRLCLGFLGNHAEANNLFKEIYVKVWYNLESFKNQSQSQILIYKIAINTALLYTSKRPKSHKKQKNVFPEDLVPSTPLNQENRIGQLYTAISELKEADRMIMTLALESCSYQEISEILGISVSDVGVKVNRIKTELTKQL